MDDSDEMPPRITLTFLGTCSGGGPLLYRQCTSTALNLSHESWLVDCAEGTQTQLLKAKYPRLSRVTKIFVTHLHIDHCMGILPLMNSALQKTPKHANDIRLELYGPPGLRKLIRMNLEITRPNIVGKYRTHELLARDDPKTSCEQRDLHENELPGRDILCDDKGLWRAVESADGFVVDAGAMVHRVRSLGYVFTETPRARRRNGSQENLSDTEELIPENIDNPIKLVILGDTSDPSAITELAQDATVLVHEATNAWLPPDLDERGLTRMPNSITEKAVSRGHSTPVMAGEFGLKIRARSLYLNHFSSKFQDPGPSAGHYKNPNAERQLGILEEIERQASEAWGMGKAVCARDLLVVDVERNGGQVLNGRPTLEEKTTSKKGGRFSDALGRLMRG